MTTTQQDFAKELGTIMTTRKIEDDEFIKKASQVIKMGLLAAAQDGKPSFIYFEHLQSDKKLEWFTDWKGYKTYYNPDRNGVNFKRIAEQLGVRWPSYHKEIYIVRNRFDDVSEFDSDDDENMDCDDDAYKKIIGWEFFNPQYDASVIEDVCCICLEEFEIGQTVNQCAKCKDCIHLTCNRQKTNNHLPCGMCRANTYSAVGDYDTKLITRMKKEVVPA
jgi:hypothetical protein